MRSAVFFQRSGQSQANVRVSVRIHAGRLPPLSLSFAALTGLLVRLVDGLVLVRWFQMMPPLEPPTVDCAGTHPPPLLPSPVSSHSGHAMGGGRGDADGEP
jgi:hypothetical protein